MKIDDFYGRARLWHSRRAVQNTENTFHGKQNHDAGVLWDR